MPRHRMIPFFASLIVLSVVAFLAGCSDPTVVNAPYSTVVAATRNYCGPAMLQQGNQRETRPGEAYRVTIPTALGRPYAVGGKRDQTEIDVRRIDDNHASLKVRVYSDDSVVIVRNWDAENNVRRGILDIVETGRPNDSAPSRHDNMAGSDDDFDISKYETDTGK